MASPSRLPASFVRRTGGGEPSLIDLPGCDTRCRGGRRGGPGSTHFLPSGPRRSWASPGKEHELLEVHGGTCVSTSVQDVDLGHGEGDGTDASEVAVERNAAPAAQARLTPRMALAPRRLLCSVPSRS